MVDDGRRQKGRYGRSFGGTFRRVHPGIAVAVRVGLEDRGLLVFEVLADEPPIDGANENIDSVYRRGIIRSPAFQVPDPREPPDGIGDAVRINCFKANRRSGKNVTLKSVTAAKIEVIFFNCVVADRWLEVDPDSRIPVYRR